MTARSTYSLHPRKWRHVSMPMAVTTRPPAKSPSGEKHAVGTVLWIGHLDMSVRAAASVWTPLCSEISNWPTGSGGWPHSLGCPGFGGDWSHAATRHLAQGMPIERSLAATAFMKAEADAASNAAKETRQ